MCELNDVIFVSLLYIKQGKRTGGKDVELVI
jgi:hypothetical protein